VTAPSQSAQAVAGVAAPAWVAYCAYESVARPIANPSPSARKSHPMGLAGRWLATMVPTPAKASSTGANANASIRLPAATP